jgi:glycerol-3-phosphate acyltransferase PlsX
MRIVLDAMGGDHAPGEIVRGGVWAARALGVDVVLVGRPEAVHPLLAAQAPVPAGVSVLPAADVIGMEEHGAEAVRRRREASIVVGLRAVREGRADAFVSAGNTGAVMAAAVLVLGRIRGVERPALGTVFPARGGRRVLLLDAGANAEVKPHYLVQFARMGQAYAQRVLGVAAPRVGLLSIGEEATKGNALVLEAHAALRGQPGLGFVGNVEGKDIPRGLVDVVVTDGFTGNVVIKVAEGVAEYILEELRAALTGRLRYRLAAAVLRPAFRALRERLDYREYGGAPLVGVQGVVVVAHGRSDARAVLGAMRVARDAVAGDLVPAIQAALTGAPAGAGSPGT